MFKGHLASIAMREHNAAELRNAGASELFVNYYLAAPEGASARREVESGPFSLGELNDSPALGGGFFAALWNGNLWKAWRLADSKNATVLESASDIPSKENARRMRTVR